MADWFQEQKNIPLETPPVTQRDLQLEAERLIAAPYPEHGDIFFDVLGNAAHSLAPLEMLRGNVAGGLALTVVGALIKGAHLQHQRKSLLSVLRARGRKLHGTAKAQEQTEQQLFEEVG